MTVHESRNSIDHVGGHPSVADQVFSRVRERWTSLAYACCQDAERFSAWSRQSTDLVLAKLATESGRAVLDLACGVGDPALQIALAYPSARVVAVDFVETMTTELERRAFRLGTGNVEVAVANIAALPFADAGFDVVTCRFGLQTYPEEAKSRILAEARRVLRPGGRLILVDWGPTGHGAVHEFYSGILREFAWPGELNPVAAAASGEDLVRLLRDTDFRHAEHRSHEIHWCWEGSRESFWSFMVEMVPAVRAIFVRLDEEDSRTAHSRILAALSHYLCDGRIELPVCNLVVTGTR